MNSAHLNEHDANQGAQSSGEFLGMTGNTGWWLLGSGGATIMMVVFLWGILGMSLLLCLLAGIVLCALSLVYVFTLKNNKPVHYDADFFETVFAESGVLEFGFGPRVRRPKNPFVDSDEADVAADDKNATGRERGERKQSTRGMTRSGQRTAGNTRTTANAAAQADDKSAKKKPSAKAPVTITEAAYETVREELEQTKELLEEALTERGED